MTGMWVWSGIVGASLLASAWMGLTLPAAAQQRDASSPALVRSLRTTMEQARRDFRPEQPSGEGWTIEGRLLTTLEHDDNVFAAPAGEVDDLVLGLRPSVDAGYDTSGYALGFDAYYRHQLFFDGTNDDIDEGGAALDGRIKFGPRDALFARVAYRRNVQDRADPEDAGGVRPEDDRVSFRLGYARTERDWAIRLQADGERYDFLTEPDDDRDRFETRLVARYRQALASGLSGFVQAEYIDIAYNDPLDDAGADRDTRRYGGRAGFAYRAGDVFYIELGLGARQNTFDDPAFGDFTALVAAGEITWKPAESTSLKLELSRDEVVTTITGASSRTRSELELRLDHEIVPRLIGFAGLIYRLDDFEGTAREDDIYLATLGAEWFVADELSLFADYRASERRSDAAGEDFTRNAFRVGARVAF